MPDATESWQLHNGDVAAQGLLEKAQSQSHSTTENSKTTIPPASAATKLNERKRHQCDKFLKAFLEYFISRSIKCVIVWSRDTVVNVRTHLHCIITVSTTRITRGIASQWALQGLSRSRISQGIPQSGHQQRLRSLITTLACASDLYLAKRATSYSKATSVHSGASSGYQENVFDSKSVNSVQLPQVGVAR